MNGKFEKYPSSAVAYAWFVWEKGFKGDPVIKWINWKDEMNMSKIILDLCGGTGSWSKPYKEAGYDVRVITLPEYDLFDTHEQ